MLTGMAHFDLNLVRVFLAIWEHRSVTAAAERLSLTQPAVSQSLRRLRDLYSDPLFLRVGNMMEPTEKARSLHAPLRHALDAISATVLSEQAFDPAATDRCFTLTMSDIAEVTLLPHLAAALRDAAPGLRLRILRLDTGTTAAQLRAGTVDLALGFLPDLSPPEVVSTPAWSDSYICLMADTHPAAGQPLTRGEFASLRFVDAGEQTPAFARIQRLLSDQNLERQVVLTTALFAGVPEILRHTDLVALFPYSAALQANARGGFYLSPLPVELPRNLVAVHHHAQFDTDPGIRWLHGLIVSILASLAPPAYDPKAARTWS